MDRFDVGVLYFILFYFMFVRFICKNFIFGINLRLEWNLVGDVKRNYV